MEECADEDDEDVVDETDDDEEHDLSTIIDLFAGNDGICDNGGT